MNKSERSIEKSELLLEKYFVLSLLTLKIGCIQELQWYNKHVDKLPNVKNDSIDSRSHGSDDKKKVPMKIKLLKRPR